MRKLSGAEERSGTIFRKIGMQANIDTIIQKIDSEFTNFQIGRNDFAMLFQDGVLNGAIHAAGVSYLLNLGIRFGLPAIAEYPITLHASESWKKLGRIFPDCVWFHPQDKTPWIALEFERFEKGDENKIHRKAQNLALSYHQSDDRIALCVFIYWLRSGSAPQTLTPLFQSFTDGFYRNGVQVSSPLCKLLIYKIVMGRPRFSDTKIMERIAPYPDGNESSDTLIIKEIRKIGGNS